MPFYKKNNEIKVSDYEEEAKQLIWDPITADLGKSCRA